MSEVYTNVVTYGNTLMYRGYDEDGNQIKERAPFDPVLFVPSKKESKYQTLDGIYVEPVNMGSVKDYRDFIKDYDGVGGMRIYGDINLECQYLGDRFKGEVDYDYSLLKVVNIDIETTCEEGFPDVEDPNEEIIGISIQIGSDTHSFGLGDFDIPDIDCHSFPRSGELELIHAFIDKWQEISPDIVTGWNIRFFDMPYLYNRIKRIAGDKVAKKLSPWNIVKEKTIHRRNREQKVLDIVGVATMDYYDLYQTFTYVNQESYRLDHIAYVELGERKLSYEEFGNIREFYKQDFQKFMEYNVKDVHLVTRLEDKLKLMELAVALAYAAKVNFMDVFSQVKMWDSIIYHYLKEHNIAVPPRAVTQKSEQYAGAYVKDPIVGMHDWIMSFDLNSLYPHLIMQYNISPETKVFNMDGIHARDIITPDGILNESEQTERYLEKWKGQDLSIASNGITFTKKFKGFLPAIMERLYEERKIAKKKMIEAQQRQQSSSDPKIVKEISKYKNEQLVRKVQLNSAYGAIGNQYCRYYDVDMAEAVTISGQLSIRWIERELNTLMNRIVGTEGEDYVVAIDTDSVYISVGSLVDKIGGGKTKQEVVDLLDKSANDVILPFIDKKYQEMADKVNAFQQKMKMGREVIADKGIWTAKKRYILNVLDNEGVRYDKPKIKVIGIETTRSSTPEAVRKQLSDTIDLILSTDEDTVIGHIERIREQFNSLDPEDIAFPRGVKGLVKYGDPMTIYAKHTPIAVKGALLYNHFIKEKGLDKKYELIRDNDKVKFIYLKEPNPIREKVITFPNAIPKELDLETFIDYNLQFEKTFLDPLKAILDAIGWKSKKESTLEGLFA
jgi:DNA polymerase elongation subunit (family B)